LVSSFSRERKRCGFLLARSRKFLTSERVKEVTDAGNKV
jgi:hypothetical protein